LPELAHYGSSVIPIPIQSFISVGLSIKPGAGSSGSSTYLFQFKIGMHKVRLGSAAQRTATIRFAAVISSLTEIGIVYH
jgi:hypothetical protein